MIKVDVWQICINENDYCVFSQESYMTVISVTRRDNTHHMH